MRESNQKERRRELVWRCSCGWGGTASQMTKDTYCCPKCGKFEMTLMGPFLKPEFSIITFDVCA